MVSRRTFKYRLYPNKEQLKSLGYQLSEACSLYNAAVQERRDAWRMQKVSRNYYDQANQLRYSSVVVGGGTRGKFGE